MELTEKEQTIDSKFDESLHDVLFTPHYENCGVEAMAFGGITIPLIQMNGYSVYIYGYVKCVSAVILFLEQFKIKVCGIIDRNMEKTKIQRADGIPILHITQLDKIPDPQNAFVIIDVYQPSGVEVSKIINPLISAGIQNYCMIAPKERDRITGNCYRIERIDYYRNHYEDLKLVLNRLKDDTSREVLLEFLRTTMRCRPYRLPVCEGRNKYFYGQTIHGVPEELYIHKKDEVWLNCGANIGDTVFQYFAHGLDANAVFAIEGNKKIYSSLYHNLNSLPTPYRKKVVPKNEFIDENTDFGELLTGKAVSLINADIEGNELDLMKALSSVIARDRPVLALCAYHKESDLIDFVTYLDSIVTDYSYILRKYPSIGFYQWGSELVMYAVPFEREVS